MNQLPNRLSWERFSMLALFRLMNNGLKRPIGVGVLTLALLTGAFIPVAKADPPTQLSQCREFITNCIEQGVIAQVTRQPADCYQGATAAGQSCAGVPRDAALGAPPVVTGAVSGSRLRAVTPSPQDRNLAAMAPGACVTAALVSNPALQPTITGIEIAASADRATWTCRRLCTNDLLHTCIEGGCGSDATIGCCPPATGIAPGATCGGRGASGAPETGAAPDAGASTPPAPTPPTAGSGAAAGGGAGGTTAPTRVGASSVSGQSAGLTNLVLPSCTQDGSCQFSDLVQVGLNLVRFLFGLAGVLLLVVFIYAGIEFLLAETVTSVKSAEDRIKKALIGLFFMFFGYTLVNFLVGVFIGL